MTNPHSPKSPLDCSYLKNKREREREREREKKKKKKNKIMRKRESDL